MNSSDRRPHKQLRSYDIRGLTSMIKVNSIEKILVNKYQQQLFSFCDRGCSILWGGMFKVTHLWVAQCLILTVFLSMLLISLSILLRIFSAGYLKMSLTFSSVFADISTNDMFLLSTRVVPYSYEILLSPNKSDLLPTKITSMWVF
jgi:hypothetical protein